MPVFTKTVPGPGGDLTLTRTADASEAVTLTTQGWQPTTPPDGGGGPQAAPPAEDGTRPAPARPTRKPAPAPGETDGKEARP